MTGRHVLPSPVPLDPSILEKVGNTPMVRLENIGKGLGSSIHVKLESENPGGSIKDRTALSMTMQVGPCCRALASHSSTEASTGPC